MLSIARTELLQLLRNRSVLVAGLIIPLAVCAVLIWKHDLFTEFGSLGSLAASLVFMVESFGLYTTVVTIIASRRQNLFLKRLRSTAASDRDILTGLLLPTAAIALIQVAGMLAVLSSVAGAPVDILFVAAAVVVVLAMMLALALATAGFTNSPEHAQVTTLPISLASIAICTWVGITGTEDLQTLKRALPGGAATELITGAWNGTTGTVTDSLLLLVPTLAWVIVAAELAKRLFRWEPRR